MQPNRCRSHTRNSGDQTSRSTFCTKFRENLSVISVVSEADYRSLPLLFDADTSWPFLICSNNVSLQFFFSRLVLEQCFVLALQDCLTGVQLMCHHFGGNSLATLGSSSTFLGRQLAPYQSSWFPSSDIMFGCISLRVALPGRPVILAASWPLFPTHHVNPHVRAFIQGALGRAGFAKNIIESFVGDNEPIGC